MFMKLEFQDVAYSLTTSLESDLLGNMDEFVDFYIERLREKLSSRALSPPPLLPASFRSAELLALKHESRILGHSSNPVLYVFLHDDQGWKWRR